jgi:hypothetical protein
MRSSSEFSARSSAVSELVFLFSADADIQAGSEFYEGFQEGRGEVFCGTSISHSANFALSQQSHPYATSLTTDCSFTDFLSAFSTPLKVVASLYPR